MALAAGPCGTVARDSSSAPNVFAWTLVHLVPHLQRYYRLLPRNPYPKLGAKSGGGNGRAELW